MSSDLTVEMRYLILGLLLGMALHEPVTIMVGL